MSPKPSVSGPFIRGVDCSTGELSQPKGSVPRLSNMIMTKRGALRTIDGSAVINAFGGVPTPRGRALCELLFAPTGVAPYYMHLCKGLDQHIGAPNNLVVTDGGSGGTVPGGTYYWKVSALDGAGGETTLSAVGSLALPANHIATLAWNVVPNAFGYNVYFSTDNVTFNLLVGPGLPVPQPAAPATSVTFDDTFGVVGVIGTVPIDSAAYSGGFATFVNHIGVLDVLPVGLIFTYSSSSDSRFTGNWRVVAITSSHSLVAAPVTGQTIPDGTVATGGDLTSTNIPSSDTTQQTALYAMPPAVRGTSYTNANLVALFPAVPNSLGGAAGGGTGGSGQQDSTPSGGVPGMVSPIPQMVQFVNQVIIALGNGYAPQIYSDDTGTEVNPAVTGAMTSATVDAFGVVTLTMAVPHGLDTTTFPSQEGATVIIAGMTPSVYNGVFQVITIPSTTTVTVRNLAAIGAGSGSGGTFTVSTIPITSSFVPDLPPWTATVNYAVNSVIVPTVPNGFYFKAIQAGTSGGSEPTWPTTVGQQVNDGSVLWQNAGPISSTAPAPPGAGHIAVYAGSLWVWNTYYKNAASGLDGPCSLRMSDVNNPRSWNPINQAFLDKDDGTEGMGLAVFTISAQGIPPQGSLVAFKNFSSYQIVGVFGSGNFAIQRVVTDMGCFAPRSIQFIPGFGIGRGSHLGVAVFDGVNDRIVSEQVRPYLLPTNDPDLSDITSVDSSWYPVSWGAQTANPPMYCMAIPVGSSSLSALTRMLVFDLVLKAWSVVDFPFSIGTLYQARPVTSNPICLFGSYDDGTLQRWMMGDVEWAVTNGALSPSKVAWSFRIPTTASKDPDQRLYCRRVVVRGQLGELPPSRVTIQPRVAGVAMSAVARPVPSSGDFSIQTAVGVTNDRFDAIVSGVGAITIDACDLQLEPRPVGVLAGFIA